MMVNNFPSMVTLRPIAEGSAAELRLPQLVAQHHQRLASRHFVVIGRERPPQLRVHSERFEIISGHDLSLFPLGLAAEFHRESNRAVRRQRFQHAILVAHRPVQGIGKRKSIARRMMVAHRYDFIRMPHAGKRLQDHCLYDAENRGIRADAQRQRQNRHQRKSRRLPQHPHSKLHVLHQSAHRFLRGQLRS